jgi:hypothetical protein
MMKSKSSEMQEAIETALHKVGIPTTGWVFVAAIIEDDGSEWLTLESSDGLASWTRLGMLSEALQFDDWDDEEEKDAE